MALTYWVGSELVPFELLTHFTTEQGRYALAPLTPLTASETAGLPANAEAGASEAIGSGATRFAAGLAIVNCSALDVPDELETVTATGLGTDVSAGKIVALS